MSATLTRSRRNDREPWERLIKLALKANHLRILSDHARPICEFDKIVLVLEPEASEDTIKDGN